MNKRIFVSYNMFGYPSDPFVLCNECEKTIDRNIVISRIGLADNNSKKWRFKPTTYFHA